MAAKASIGLTYNYYTISAYMQKRIQLKVLEKKLVNIFKEIQSSMMMTANRSEQLDQPQRI